MSDSYLFDAGWLFFAIWTVILAVVGAAAFGGEFLSSRSQLRAAKEHARIKPGPR